MDTKKIATLEIWNNKLYAEATLNFLDVMIGRLDIPHYQAFRFVVGEILVKRMESAYPDNRGLMYVDIFLKDTFFEVSIRDKGVPGWQDFSYDQENIVGSKKDLRNYMLTLLADGVGMEKLGKDGQRIFIRLKTINSIQFKRPQPYKEMEVLDTNISIRPVETQEDIIEAIRCIYSEYGYSYSYEKLYYVDSFKRALENRELMAFLAVNEHGQTAGHFALSFSEQFRNMPEIASTVIRREFRGLGLIDRFIEYCLEVAKKNNFRAVMSQPVAFHPKAQKALLKAGFTASSLLLSYISSGLESEYNENKERLDVCACVKIIDATAYSKIYPPKELTGFLKKIYDRLDWQYEFCDDRRLSDSTQISIENHEQLKVTKMILRETADDLEMILKEAIQNTIKNKNEMMELVISLNSVSAEYGYQIAKKCGFALSGVIPGSANGDYLIMQMLAGEEIKYDKLVLAGEFEELKEDILKLL